MNNETFDNYGKIWREVDFFLRLHRHLPDRFCGDTLGRCNYRPDGIAINAANDYVEELQKDPEFRRKEKEIEKAVEKQWNKNRPWYKRLFKIFKPPSHGTL